MKTHFGFISNEGDYESPLEICEKTACGYTSEIVTENATEDWEEVTCKKCLRLKEGIEKWRAKENELIAEQMGAMATFFENVEVAKRCKHSKPTENKYELKCDYGEVGIDCCKCSNYIERE